MDEYQLEIQDIRRTLLRLKADKAAEELIEEYEAELRNLVALHQAATETFEQGRRQARLRDALAELGFGEWTLTNVYSFVYEAASLSAADSAAQNTQSQVCASALFRFIRRFALWMEERLYHPCPQGGLSPAVEPGRCIRIHLMRAFRALD